MIDFITRFARHPIDYFGALSWHKLKLVRIEHMGGTIYSFIFETKNPLSWRAGQHGVFWFLNPNMRGKNWRAFSIASSMHEGEIRIATHIPETPSNFKQKLKAMGPGDHIYMQGPFGEFHAHNKKQIVGIAGGIGITPFRALTYDIAHDHIKDTKLKLIYSAMNNEYTFKDELEEWAASDRVEIVYTATPEEVNAALDTTIKETGDNAHYFISGSPGMIGALKQTCQQKGVSKIVNDPFKGY